MAMLQERYTELADAVFLVASALSTRHDALSAALAAAAAAASGATAEAARLRERLAAATAAGEEAAAALLAARGLSEQVQQDSEISAALLRREVAVLKQQLYEERQQHERHVAASAAQAEAAEAAADARLACSEQELRRLRERLTFTEGKVAALREQLARPAPATCCTAAQTEPACSDRPEGDACPASVAVGPDSASSSSSEDDDGALEAELLLPQPVDLRQLVGRGRVRGRLWLLQQIAQLTADRAAADAAFIAGRQDAPCAGGWGEYVLGWSRTRLGLSDLATSLAHHAGRGLLPAVWLAHMCGIGSTATLAGASGVHRSRRRRARVVQPQQGQQNQEQEQDGCSCRVVGSGPLSPDAATQALLATPQAAGYWVFAACQLAFPNSVSALFCGASSAAPDSTSAAQCGPLVAAGVPDSLRAVFRRLEGEERAASSLLAAFVAQRLPAAAAVEQRAATATSYHAWCLLGLLMEEWLMCRQAPTAAAAVQGVRDG